jgi:hypothetical protein
MTAEIPPQSVDQEADRIYGALLGRPAPEVIRERFAEPSRRLDERLGPEETARYREALRRVGDLEALEVACRYRNRLPLLSLKFRAMLYLIETLPENQPRFIKERSNLWSVFWALKIGALRTAWKLGKGLMLCRRVPGV